MTTENIHIIDGVKYREVDRKAKVDEKVIVVNPKYTSVMKDYEVNEIFTVICIRESSVDVDRLTPHRSDNLRLWNDEYRVLEPIEATEIDVVNKPPHYNAGRFEVIDVIEDAVKGADGFEGACVANVLKYTMRYRHKNGLEDIRKAAWYLARLERYLAERDEKEAR